MNNKEIKIKELLVVLWNKKVLIGLIALITLIVGVIGGFVYDKNTEKVATIISLEWEGIENGEYPDGSRFDYTQIFSPNIMTIAIMNTDLDLTSNDVRNNLKVIPIVPNNVVATIQNSLLDGEELTYFATNYRIEIDNKSLGVSAEESIDLLEEIINALREDYDKRFIQVTQIPDYISSDLVEYDYIDAYDILVTETDLIQGAVKNKANTSFNSPTLGYSFNDILVQSNLIEQIELEYIASGINTYLLTKNKDYLITNYIYKIEVSQLKLDKTIDKKDEVKLLIDNYSGSVDTILIPGLDGNSEFSIDTYYNTLIEEYVDLQYDIADLTNDIDYYQLQIDRLEGNDPNYIFSASKIIEEEERVQAYIETTIEKLETLVTDINIMLLEYNDLMISNNILMLTSPSTQSIVPMTLVALVSLVIGIGIGGVTVLIKHDWNE